jgi:putative glutamine amidotransferase
MVDGLILAGGGDIAPAIYHALPHPANDTIDHERDATELALARLALRTTLPVLGICRGAQVLGVAGGSPLVQHIPDAYGDAVAHRADPPGPIEHHIEIEPHSHLAHILGATSLPVQSWHHQAVQSAPPGWRSVAFAADGVIEAIEHQHHPWMVGVQWHPELTGASPHHRRLFNALIHAAENRKATE